MKKFYVKLKYIFYSTMIEQKIKSRIRDVADFPKPGIVFKDITPILLDQSLCTEIVDEFIKQIEPLNVEVIVGIESRGFLFGLLIANRMGIPFVPIRKRGKLPSDTHSIEYSLEYGTASIELHKDALKPNQRVMLHDDLLATGGTIMASVDLIEKTGAQLAGFSFLISLDFLEAKEKLKRFSENIVTLANY